TLSPTFTRSVYEEVASLVSNEIYGKKRNLIWKEKRGSSLAGNLLLLLGFSVTLALPWTNSVMNVEFLGFSVTMKAKCYYMDESDASYESWNWDTDSMKNFHFDSIICASKDHNIVGAISKPSDWPSLKFYSTSLKDSRFFELASQPRQIIKGTFLIADSVIKEDQFQSYTDVGYLVWLRALFS
ncbi:LOW QUALITY PROTEIN: hypothetical protein HID58_093983, partial [Brassica napus]